jgi:hypothetical protein
LFNITYWFNWVNLWKFETYNLSHAPSTDWCGFQSILKLEKSESVIPKEQNNITKIEMKNGANFFTNTWCIHLIVHCILFLEFYSNSRNVSFFYEIMKTNLIYVHYFIIISSKRMVCYRHITVRSIIPFILVIGGFRDVHYPSWTDSIKPNVESLLFCGFPCFQMITPFPDFLRCYRDIIHLKKSIVHFGLVV